MIREFLTCYGFLWFVFSIFAIVTSAKIDLGMFGAFGFPIISIIYALVRKHEVTAMETKLANKIDNTNEQIRSLQQQLNKRTAKETLKNME